MRVLASALAAGLLVLAAAPAVAAPEPEPAGPIAIKAQDVDIGDFIQQVARLADITVIVDPRVRGTVSVNVDQPMSKGELMNLFVSTLRQSGVGAVPSIGGAYRIFPIDDGSQTL